MEFCCRERKRGRRFFKWSYVGETCRLSLNADGSDVEKELTHAVKYEISFASVLLRIKDILKRFKREKL